VGKDAQEALHLHHGGMWIAGVGTLTPGRVPQREDHSRGLGEGPRDNRGNGQMEDGWEDHSAPLQSTSKYWTETS
jgi:hypothetical protein